MKPGLRSWLPQMQTKTPTTLTVTLLLSYNYVLDVFTLNDALEPEGQQQCKQDLNRHLVVSTQDFCSPV